MYLFKTEYSVRTNHCPSTTKNLQKEFITQSQLRSTFLENKIEENQTAFKKQKSCCVIFLRKEKKSFFENLDTSNITKRITEATLQRCFQEKLF